MRENKVAAKRQKFLKITIRQNPKAQVVENKLQQDFSATKPNEKWVSDITYVWTQLGWLYVAAIMDLFSRRIVGLAMAKRMTTALVLQAFRQAIKHRAAPEGLLYHSDKGSQYTSEEFQQELTHYGVTVSMSGTGNCFDNAAMESFFATLKTECVYFENYRSQEEAEISIFDYTEVFYNNQRQHSYLGYVSPTVFEERYYLRNENVH